MSNDIYPTGSVNTLVDFSAHPDFVSKVQAIPQSFLQNLYEHYLANQDTIARRDNLDPPPQKDGVRGSPPSSASQTPSASEIVLRHSVFLLIINLITIEFLFDSFYLILKVLPIPLNLSFSFQSQLWPIYFGIFGILLLFKTVLMVFAAIQWVTTSYEIRDNEIRYRYGIFSHHEKIFMCAHTQEVTFAQGILGRIFNFGSVEIYSPVIKEHIILASIPNPQHYAEIIKGNIPGSNSSTLNYYPLQQEEEIMKTQSKQ